MKNININPWKDKETIEKKPFKFLSKKIHILILKRYFLKFYYFYILDKIKQ
jgi:hypothetical protein